MKIKLGIENCKFSKLKNMFDKSKAVQILFYSLIIYFYCLVDRRGLSMARKYRPMKYDFIVIIILFVVAIFYSYINYKKSIKYLEWREVIKVFYLKTPLDFIVCTISAFFLANVIKITFRAIYGVDFVMILIF